MSTRIANTHIVFSPGPQTVKSFAITGLRPYTGSSFIDNLIVDSLDAGQRLDVGAVTLQIQEDGEIDIGVVQPSGRHDYDLSGHNPDSPNFDAQWVLAKISDLLADRVGAFDHIDAEVLADELRRRGYEVTAGDRR